MIIQTAVDFSQPLRPMNFMEKPNSIFRSITKKTLAITPLLISILLMSGCASTDSAISGGLNNPAAVKSDAWKYKDVQGTKMTSDHYRIHTTISAEDVKQLLPQVMEGAYTHYRKLVPDIKASNDLMDCYIFLDRMEFNQFTKENTGRDSGTYLQIRRGGYALGDRYVSYYIGDALTASVASHEGWHQFVARNFIGRLPPFMEEGFATTFEGIKLGEGQLPKWNTSLNPTRAQALQRCIDSNHLWPTEKLVRLHAGEVVKGTGDMIDAFYSQCWAFAKFLKEYDKGKYAPALKLWLEETANGTVYDPTHSHSRAGMPWNPGAVKPMLEHYLGKPLAEIDREFQLYMRYLVKEEFPKQWNLNNWEY